jgi:hypothetical protein
MESELEAPPGEIEVEFSPMDMAGGGVDPLLQFLAAANAMPQGGAGQAPNAPHSPAKGGREAELDSVLASMLGSGMMPPGADGRMVGGPMPSGFSEEIVMEGPDGTQVMTMGGPDGAVKTQGTGKSSMPANLLRDLFPVPVDSDAPVVIEGPPMGMLGADPLMRDMMQAMDRSFTQQVMPAIHQATPADRDPGSCREDIQKKCGGAKSHLHCLGMNHATISEACRKSVGQSVPFLCSRAIDRYCDVLQTGILSCLYDHLPDLDGPCRDAVQTTQHVINKVNSQQVSLIDPKSGSKIVSTPATANPGLSSPSNKEATLDAKLGLRSAVSSRSPEPFLSKSQQVPAPQSAGHSTRLTVFLLLALVAFGVYLYNFTDYARTVQARLLGHSPEGTKLLNSGIEIPRPDAMR